MRHNKHEERQIRKMRVVRSWQDGEFKYFTLYSDGLYESATRSDAVKYAKAYNTDIKTIIGLPEETTWSITGN